jgi:putative oxidoreductase
VLTPADVVTRVARPMLAGMFVAGGLDAVRRPATKLAKAGRVIAPLEESVGIDADPVELVRLNGIVQVGAGVALASSTFPRAAALALACSLVPTTIAGHAFWREDDAAARAQQRIHFLKNVAMLGGLLLATRA